MSGRSANTRGIPLANTEQKADEGATYKRAQDRLHDQPCEFRGNAVAVPDSVIPIAHIIFQLITFKSTNVSTLAVFAVALK
jgi:hypothetical protein